MPLPVSYMGTKRSIAPRVAAVIADSPPGPLLDLFSGICAIGSAVSPARQIWCNDVQLFASTVATSFFTSPVLPLPADEAAQLIRAQYFENYSALHERFHLDLCHEHAALKSNDLHRIQSLEGTMPNVASSPVLEHERQDLANHPNRFPYRLFSITYSGGYLGLGQCLAIDSLRYGLDASRESGYICENQHRWMCLALCQAMNRIATTTGHFAQYLRANQNTVRRFSAQRKRSVWSEWLAAIAHLSPIGTRSWRTRNRVFRQDANVLLQYLCDNKIRPAVIYADPPYTKDQYSRYYHLYETLLLYDYPASQGTGRYRPNRLSSPYSVKSRVENALQGLVRDCAKLGSSLVLSYPERGLFSDSQDVICELLHRHYDRVFPVITIQHFHSTLGASKGKEKRKVNELIFAAR